MKLIYAISRRIHKWAGLLLLLFCVWMSLSGILLNHPELIADISVPGWLIPPQYHLENWDRSSLINLVFSGENPDLCFAAGKQGMWKSSDGGVSFSPMDDGFPESRYYFKTNHIHLEEKSRRLLLASTDGGLYACDPLVGKWSRVHLGDNSEPVRKVLNVKGRLLAVTDSNFYLSGGPGRLDFDRVEVPRDEEKREVTLVQLFFDLHGGGAWGLPGKLLFDIVGVSILFLSVSAFYLWWRNRRGGRGKAANGNKAYKTFFKYHLRIGIIVAAVLLVIGVTGFFMRPPFLAAIARGSVDAGHYPGFLDANPWHEKIHNALYDAVEDKIVVETTEGVWSGPAAFDAPFEKTQLGVPVFVMGATVFEPYGSGGYLVGSFNGIYHLERESGQAIDLQTGEAVGWVSPVRPADVMVTGYFRTPDGEEFITAHEQGLMPLHGGDARGRFEMPREMADRFEMSLWNYMFELHNGRLFKDLIGGWYLLLLPLGSFLFVLVTVTGVFDWIYLKTRRKGSGTA